MAAAPFRVLLVEDDDRYAALVREELESSHALVSLTHVRTLREAIATVGRGAVADAILLDLNLPDSSGILTVQGMLDASPHIPVVVLTASRDEAAALGAVQRGAHDYLVKDAADGQTLVKALRYARERHALRRALHEREARFRALVEHSYDAITLLDRDGNVLFDSSAIERITGFTPGERVGCRFDAVAHPEDLPMVERRFADCLSRECRPVHIEYRYQHKDGGWRWAEAVCVNHLDDPAVGPIVVNHRDVTERKLTEEALRQSEEQLRQAHKMEAVGRLAGGVAHDFNNLLTAIFGYADLLLDQFPEEDPRRVDVEEIRRSAERAAALTRQLLAFSRKQVMQRRTVNLNEVVRGIEGLVARLVTGDIRVLIRTDDGLWPVRADPGQIEQVLMNLAANARDAMPNGGELRIETANRIVTASDGVDLPPGEYVSLIVSDTGIGIPEHVRRHIFEPFFTTKAFGKGTGLGLSTVYGIVKQTGGTIDLDSGPGAGTRFAILLPRATSSP